MEAFFDAGRAKAPIPSEALIARILADAEAERPLATEVQATKGWRFLGGFLADLGGWRAAAGMGFAGLIGLWVGYSTPAVLDPADAIFSGGYSYDVADLTLTADDFWGEG